MKKLLLLPITFALITALAGATTIPMTNPNIATMVIPDGSTITSQHYEPPGNTFTGRWTVTFVFQDGYGSEWNDYNDGGQGWIAFNQPVSNLSINWIEHGDGSFSSCHPPTNCPSQGTTEFDGPTSGLFWWIYPGWGGVDSMSYTLTDPTPLETAPEPMSLALLPLGLIALGIVGRKNRTQITS